MTPAVLDHLWQSTLMALGVALLILAFRRAAAAVRYGLWFAASVKFLVPFAALAALGRVLAPAVRFPVHAAPETVFIEKATQPFSQASLSPVPVSHSALSRAPLSHAFAAVPPVHAAPQFDLALILAGVWALGCVVVIIAWMVRSARVRSVVRSATPLPWPGPMPVLASSSLMEPGLVGLWRPVLLVPNTLSDHLAQSEIDAILAHEASHLRRRDNVTAAIHMLVEALFWFHPMVWWIGARLIEERERACDEAVVRSGHDRAAYARSLVECCRLYLRSPLPCVAGASGSKLKMRVETIMTAPLASPLSRSRKALLLAAGVCAFATPVAAGLLTSPAGQQVAARAVAVAAGLAPPRSDQARAAAPTAAAPSAPDERGAAAAITVARNEAVPAPDPSVAATDAPPTASAQDIPASRAEPAPIPSAPQTLQSAPAQAILSATQMGPVTVHASPSSAEMKKQTQTFVQSYAAAPNPEIDQIGRWREAVCVKVVGLPQADQAAAIKARIESVARAVGLPATRADCRTNVEIVFTDRPQAVMDSIARRHEYLLGYEHRHETNRLKTVTHPIQAWYVTATRGNGENIAGALFAGFPVQIDTEVIDDPDDNTPPVGCGDSPRFTACLRSVLRTVFMVADSKTLAGKDLGLVADDMVMLTLSQPRSLDGCNALPSVIDRFAKAPCPSRDPPDGLTPADAAYLTALYASDPEANTAGEQSDIARRMARILISANADTKAR
jgi:beta-lactamase regulating signal transducer with metallopeptidase domain